MKPLKKKLCISACLDKLFEAVDDDCNEKRSTSLVRLLIPVPQEEYITRRKNRCRRYKNEWLKFQKESNYYRSTLQKLLSAESYWPVAGSIPRMKKPSKEIEPRDNHSISHTDQVKGDRVKQKAKVRVDIALSTSFLASVRKRVTGKERGTSTREKIDVSTQTIRDERPAAKGSVYRGIAIYRYTAEYSMRNRIIQNIASNKKSFLATKSTKRTNLSLRNHKSTQFDLRLNVESFGGKHQKVAKMEVTNSEKKLEELFHCKNLRKWSGILLKRAVQLKSQLVGKGATRGSRLIHLRVSSEPKIVRHRMDAIARKRSSHSSDGYANASPKKSLVTATPETEPKTTINSVLCYAVCVPPDNRTPSYDTIPTDTFPYDTFTRLRPNWFDSYLNPFRMETDCEMRFQTGNDEETRFEEVLPEAQPDEAVFMDLVEKKSEKLLQKERTSSEESVQLRHMILQALGPRIIEEVKQLSLREEMQKSSTEPSSDKPSPNDLVLQWELEIEIQSHDSGNFSTWRQLVREGSNRGMTKEGTNEVILICPGQGQLTGTTESKGEVSCGSDMEECYLKDEKLRKMYRASVPQNFLQATERRLKKIGRR